MTKRSQRAGSLSRRNGVQQRASRNSSCQPVRFRSGSLARNLNSERWYVAKQFPKRYDCATEFTLQILGGKWKTVILCYLTQRPYRYGELRRLIPKLSDKVLTERLHDLIEAGLVVRKPQAENSKVEFYALTSKGATLGELLEHVYNWGLSHAAMFKVEVGEPLARLETT